MADYQYQPDMNDPVTKLRAAMDNMDGMALMLALTPSLTYFITYHSGSYSNLCYSA
jgi:hypothetical protein